MKKLIAVFALCVLASIALADEKVIGEAFNPCGEPHKLTASNYENYGDGIIYNGHKYPGGFFFFYGSEADAEFHHKLWAELKQTVEQMAAEEKIDVSKKCDFTGLVTVVDEARWGVQQ